MKQYRVVKSCVGMPFDKRYFEKGEIIEVEDGVDPKSDCFELLTKAEVVPVAPEINPGDTLKGIQERTQEATSPKKGMGAGLNAPIEEKKPQATKIKKAR